MPPQFCACPMRVRLSADVRPGSRQVSQSRRNEGSAPAKAEAGVPGSVIASPRSYTTGRPGGANAPTSGSILFRRQKAEGRRQKAERLSTDQPVSAGGRLISLTACLTNPGPSTRPAPAFPASRCSVQKSHQPRERPPLHAPHSPRAAGAGWRTARGWCSC